MRLLVDMNLSPRWEPSPDMALTCRKNPATNLSRYCIY